MTTKLHRTEVEKAQAVPGIEFVDGGIGRRARLSGTGVDVFEVIKAYHDFGDSEITLAEEWDWLTPDQLHAALKYFALFPDEIDGLLAVAEALVPESMRD